MARLVLVSVAVVCVAVAGFWLRATLLESEAQRVSQNPFAVADTGRAARAERDFEAAERRNPDTRPKILRGHLLLRERRFRSSVEVLSEVVEDEPENAEAWALLAVAAAEVDPRLAGRARARLGELNPRVYGGR